jgi:alanine dehydrogenase
MKIGIPKETKSNESRVALIPADVQELVQAGHSVFVEHNAGAEAGFPDSEYVKAGAQIVNDVWGNQMVVKVKARAIDPLKENQVFMAYLHVEKGQSPKMLEKLLELNITGYAFEEIRDEQGVRQVNLGFEAGIVGMYEGFRTYGQMLEKRGVDNPFALLPDIHEINKEKAYSLLRELQLPKEINITIMGYGNVYHGVQEVLDQLGIKPLVLTETETPNMERYLPDCDILVNAVAWEPHIGHLVTQDMLKLMKKTALVLDISCDEKGAIETCIPTSWKEPTYKVEGIIHSCIDNLPTAIPNESSTHLSEMILPFVMKVASGEEFKGGLMTEKGRLVYGKS